MITHDIIKQKWFPPLQLLSLVSHGFKKAGSFINDRADTAFQKGRAPEIPPTCWESNQHEYQDELSTMITHDIITQKWFLPLQLLSLVSHGSTKAGSITN